MGKTRALLTETDREQITGEHGDKRRYQATTRIRDRVDELKRDAEILAKHHPELLSEFREAIGATEDERLKRLSAELDEPITVGDRVYEDGDSHPLDGPEAAPDGGETA
jgi:hypothetical protein